MTMSFAIARELMNGYLFFLDLIIVTVLLTYLIARHDGFKTEGWQFALGLMIYVIGQSLNRWWLWRWWSYEAELTGTNWAVAIAEVKRDPTLLIGTMIITIGLMYSIRVLMGAYWGAWAWMVAFAIAVASPIMVLLMYGKF
jgi:hypothetical protein